ncbi:phosphotransferase family protein [Pseudoduganella sp. UC29_106]|uniref:phosphotransferase family protein n=1 Tax=Pseudoduganella sp. UC29_106 TaxID=3374553 RepID=UPI003757C7F9
MDTSKRDALAGFIAREAGARQVTITHCERLSGGAIQENWRIQGSIDGGPHESAFDYVLRTDAPSGVGVSHGRAEEFALLRAAFARGVTVPEPLWLCADSTVLGRPFCLMRRAAGSAAGHLLVKDGKLGGDRKQLAWRLGSELARIHSIVPEPGELAFLPRSEGAPALRLVQRYRDWLDTQPVPRPALEWGLRWLERHAPPAGKEVLCHRDYRTGNYLVDADGLTAILDWEFAGWSDPLEDIGWFCAKCWRFGANEREAGGIGEREDFYRGYEEESGAPLPRAQVHYWEVMAHMSWAIIALQQAARHSSGEERSLMLALTGHKVPELEFEILDMTAEA